MIVVDAASGVLMRTVHLPIPYDMSVDAICTFNTNMIGITADNALCVIDANGMFIKLAPKEFEGVAVMRLHHTGLGPLLIGFRPDRGPGLAAWMVRTEQPERFIRKQTRAEAAEAALAELDEWWGGFDV